MSAAEGVFPYDDAMVGDGAVLARGVADHAMSLFSVSDGEPRAFHLRDGTMHPYVAYVLGHKGHADMRAALAHMMAESVLDKLKAAGATELVWRKRPTFEYDESRLALGVRITHFRMRCAAIDAEGNDVVIDELVKNEGEVPPNRAYLDDDGVPLQAAKHPRDPDTVDDEPLQTDLSAASIETMEVDIKGRDVVAPDEEAVLLCTRLCYNTTLALNDMRNEYTVPWDQARDSTRYGVLALIKDPTLTPEQQHAKWTEYKLAEGWVYGETKDEQAKTHPCLVPYAALPAVQREKDVIFQAIVRTFFGLPTPRATA